MTKYVVLAISTLFCSESVLRLGLVRAVLVEERRMVR